jgi:hypothetical protein
MPDDLRSSALAGETLALTQAQLGVLQGQQMAGDQSVFHAAECVELSGSLETEAFEQALRNTLLEARPLHVRVFEQNGRFQQQLVEPRADTLYFRDLSGPDSELRFETELREALATPFDADNGRLFEHRLYKLDAQRHVWLHRAHHLLLDGYGFQLVTRRVAARYAALRAGSDCAAASFGDLRAVVAADVAYQQSADREADRRFWLETLAGLQPPSLSRSPSPGIGRGRRHGGTLAGGTSARVKSLAAEFGLSWPELLIAGFAGYLGVHGDSNESGRDVVIGLPIMQRLGGPASRTPCTAMNVMPLPVPRAGEQALPKLASAVRENLQRLRPHARYRFEHLEGDLEAAGYARGLLATEINVMPFEHPSRFGDCRAQTRILAAGPVEDLAAIFIARADDIGFDLDGRPQNYTPAELATHWSGFGDFLAGWLDEPWSSAQRIGAPR